MARYNHARRLCVHRLFLVLYRLEVIISLLRDTKNERHDND
jgi:hypothetical protein